MKDLHAPSRVTSRESDRAGFFRRGGTALDRRHPARAGDFRADVPADHRSSARAERHRRAARHLALLLFVGARASGERRCPSARRAAHRPDAAASRVEIASLADRPNPESL